MIQVILKRLGNEVNEEVTSNRNKLMLAMMGIPVPSCSSKDSMSSSGYFDSSDSEEFEEYFA